MDFKVFAEAVAKNIKEMSQQELFNTNRDRDVIFETYINAFPEGTNPVYRERTEHDCSCCKQFIRNIGGVVSINDDLSIKTIWDVEIGGYYQEVADALAAYVRSLEIVGIYRNDSNKVGLAQNYEYTDGEPKLWNHFYAELPASKVLKTDYGTFNSGKVADRDVLYRGLTELNQGAVETVLELIQQGSLYRGNEHKQAVQKFAKLMQDTSSIEDLNLYAWKASQELGGLSRFKNTVIGTLVSDISSGVDLENAVKMFESKVAPANYKRPKALVTQKMIDNAEKKIVELGYENAIARRFATKDDITVNNVLFVDRDAGIQGQSLLSDLKPTAQTKKQSFDKVEEVSAEKFLKDILPTAQSIELMMENKHVGNLMTLVAPVNSAAKGMFKWGNNFSWSYNGEVADSMKERVKAAGGCVDGVLRFSIQWNDDRQNENDLDAHCIEPNGNEIYYGNARRKHTSSGMLDVDITRPNGSVAVENIIYTDLNKMPNGVYHFYIHNYSDRNGVDFSAQIEFDGQIFDFEHKGKCKNKTTVAKIKKTDSGFEIIESMNHSQSSRTEWGVTTQEWQKVSMVMNSPNHWDGEETGNKHLFFILDECTMPVSPRGFYNEFLDHSLNDHRKVFEMIGSRMKPEYTEDQLSGLGFSETKRDEVVVKVGGAFNRVIKVKF